MTNKKIVFMSLLFCLWGGLSLSAQKKNDLLIVKDSLTQKDTLLLNAHIADDNPIDMQYVIHTQTEYLGKKSLTPTEVSLFRKDKKTYLSCQVKIGNQTRHVFMQRVLIQDNLSIIKFIDDQKKTRLYYKIGTGEEVFPLSVTENGKEKNALNDYLLSLASTPGDKALQDYIKDTKPTVSSYKKRAYICRTGNLNLISELRWGVLGGVGFSQCTRNKDLNSDQQIQWYAGVFADVPLAFGGISFHPEFSFIKVSNLTKNEIAGYKDIAYNRTSIRLPLLLRYTIAHLAGKVLPYLQAGPELNFRIAGNTQIYSYHTDDDGYMQEPTFSDATNKSFLSSVVAGAGVEIKTDRNHSWFIDLRYQRDLTKDTYEFRTNGWYLTLSYNL